jgi:hypothetical protein
LKKAFLQKYLQDKLTASSTNEFAVNLKTKIAPVVPFTTKKTAIVLLQDFIIYLTESIFSRVQN